jgi:hypothetical protein
VLGAVMVAIALAPTIAPTTMAILMLLPLSAFEATAALPGAAVALTRARIAATQLRQLAAPAALTRTRPTLAPLDVRPELLTPDALFAADRTVVVATHHLPDDVDCPIMSPSNGE